MKKLFLFAIILSFFSSCKTEQKQTSNKPIEIKTEIVNNENYELIKPVNKINAVLILFGGYPESAGDIKREFDIIDIAKENSIAVFFMSFNRKLWLEENEKRELATLLQNAISENKLPTDNIYIGGFSSGGNVSMLISNYIIGMKQFYIDPKGVFLIDSPIDFLAMHQASKRIIERANKNGLVQESTWLKETLENKFGNPNDSISSFEQYAIYTSKTKSINNIRNLKNTKIRLYTEPDTLWWKKFDANYEDMNAFNIKSLYNVLEMKFEGQNVEYIPTENKGYRSDGQRNPHSWSIVDKKDLVHWMLDKNNSL